MIFSSMHLCSGSPSVTIIDNKTLALNYPKTKAEMVTEAVKL